MGYSILGTSDTVINIKAVVLLQGTPYDVNLCGNGKTNGETNILYKLCSQKQLRGSLITAKI